MKDSKTEQPIRVKESATTIKMPGDLYFRVKMQQEHEKQILGKKTTINELIVRYIAQGLDREKK